MRFDSETDRADLVYASRFRNNRLPYDSPGISARGWPEVDAVGLGVQATIPGNSIPPVRLSSAVSPGNAMPSHQRR